MRGHRERPRWEDWQGGAHGAVPCPSNQGGGSEGTEEGPTVRLAACGPEEGDGPGGRRAGGVLSSKVGCSGCCGSWSRIWSVAMEFVRCEGRRVGLDRRGRTAGKGRAEAKAKPTDVRKRVRAGALAHQRGGDVGVGRKGGGALRNGAGTRQKPRRRASWQVEGMG